MRMRGSRVLAALFALTAMVRAHGASAQDQGQGQGEWHTMTGPERSFTAAEQEFHDRKAFTNVPARCPACRSARQATRGHYSSPKHPATTGNQRRPTPQINAPMK